MLDLLDPHRCSRLRGFELFRLAELLGAGEEHQRCLQEASQLLAGDCLGRAE